MSWGRPELLYGLWATPLIALFLWGALRSRARALVKLGALASARVSDRTAAVHRLRALAVLFSLALGLVALAQPRWGYRWQELKREGLSIVVVLDVSRSMDATDVSPSRMERAQRKVLDLADLLSGDKVGLVLFAGGAYPRMPLTLDYGALRQIVRDSSTSSLRAQGSDIGAAIDQAVALLGPQGTADRAILLVTDGEDQVGEAAAAAERAAAAGVHLYALGVGTPEGAPIPLAEGGFKKDNSGSVVLSRLDEDGLTRLAQIGAGAYVRAGAGGADLRALYEDEIRGKLVSAELGARQEKIWNERYQWPLAAALALMMLAAATRPGRLRLPGVGAALLLSVGLAGSGLARAADEPAAGASAEVARLQAEQTAHPGDLAVAERLGKALFDAGDYRRSEEVLRAVAERSPDPTQRQRARANAGLAAYKGGRLQQSLEDYQAVLKERPDHPAAAQNSAAVQREIALRMQQQPPEQQPQSGGQSQDQSQDQNQDQSQDPQADDTGQQDQSQDQSQSQDQNQDQNQDQASQQKTSQDQRQDQGQQPESDGTREAREDTGAAEPADAAEAQAGQEGQDTGQGTQGGDDAGDEERPGAISAQEADRMLDGVEEGEPRVIVNPKSRGGKDW